MVPGALIVRLLRRQQAGGLGAGDCDVMPVASCWGGYLLRSRPVRGVRQRPNLSREEEEANLAAPQRDAPCFRAFHGSNELIIC